jgi:hypothetical protein
LVAVHHPAGNLLPADAPSVTLGAQPLEFDPEFFGGFNFSVEGFEFRQSHRSFLPHEISYRSVAGVFNWLRGCVFGLSLVTLAAMGD